MTKNSLPYNQRGTCQRMYDYLSGLTALPDNLIIGNDCRRHHGVNGKAVRRASNKACVICQKKSDQRKSVKKAVRKTTTKPSK